MIRFVKLFFVFVLLVSFTDPYSIKRISDANFRYEFYTSTKEVKAQIPICETIIVGEVPEQKAELIRGKVININPYKKFAFFKPDISGGNTLIPAHLVINHSLTNDMEIYVLIEDYVDNRTQETKTIVKRIETL